LEKGFEAESDITGAIQEWQRKLPEAGMSNYGG